MGKLADANHWLTLTLSGGTSRSVMGPGWLGGGARGSRDGVSSTPSHSEYQLLHYVVSRLAAWAAAASHQDASSSVTLFAHKWRRLGNDCLSIRQQHGAAITGVIGKIAPGLHSMAIMSCFNAVNQVTYQFLTSNYSSPTGCWIFMVKYLFDSFINQLVPSALPWAGRSCKSKQSICTGS